MAESPLAKLDRLDRENQRCAEIVLADPERYPAIMQEWAQMVIEASQNKCT